MGWALREQAAYDFGIDALAEECDDGYLTGRLIALVVKAGRSLFSEPDGGGGCTAAGMMNSRTGSAIRCR